MTIEDYDLLSGAISFFDIDEFQMKKEEEIHAGMVSIENDSFKFGLFEDEAIVEEVSARMEDIIIPDFVEHNIHHWVHTPSHTHLVHSCVHAVS